MSKSLEDKLKSNMERFLAKQEENIQKFGYSFIVTATETSLGMISMVYTVGLADQGLPEFIVFALPAEAASAFVKNAVDILKSGALEFDTPTKKVAQGHVVFKKIPSEATDGYLNVANDRAGRRVDAVQIVWPDPAGLFPWEAGFDESMRELQPALFNRGDSAECQDSAPAPVLH